MGYLIVRTVRQVDESQFMDEKKKLRLQEIKQRIVVVPGLTFGHFFASSRGRYQHPHFAEKDAEAQRG